MSKFKVGDSVYFIKPINVFQDYNPIKNVEYMVTITYLGLDSTGISVNDGVSGVEQNWFSEESFISKSEHIFNTDLQDILK